MSDTWSVLVAKMPRADLVFMRGDCVGVGESALHTAQQDEEQGGQVLV